MALFRVRSEKINEKFQQTVRSGVTDSKLLAILGDVNGYWKDLFRPALTCFSCEAVGGEPQDAEDAALVFTLASAGFGIHDDILDKSDFKHLRMTILGIHGVDGALLVGDLLIAKGWSIFHEMIRRTHNPLKIANIMEEFARSSVEVCEAELMETLCRRDLNLDLDCYGRILWKAMAEIEVLTRVGAIMGEGQVEEIQALAEFGRRIGFISRLADDVEDCLNTKGDLLHRIEFESVPLPILYAAKVSTKKYERIRNLIEKSSHDPSIVKELLGYCFETEAFVYVRNLALKNKRAAAKQLRSLVPSAARDVLSMMLEMTYARLTSLCI
jgi:geranylgeranyl pyrophosphate synthase